jgi:hypothetical protein
MKTRPLDKIAIGVMDVVVFAIGKLPLSFFPIKIVMAIPAVVMEAFNEGK